MNKEFEVHMLNDAGKERARDIAQAFDELLAKLLAIRPEPCREMSIVRTKLEEACFFAKKAMAQQPHNSGQDPFK
jgi:hypothetical protein